MPSRWDRKGVDKVLDTNKYRNSFRRMTLFKYRKENTHTLEKCGKHTLQRYFSKCKRHFSNNLFVLSLPKIFILSSKQIISLSS